ncbi:hypothetical protein ScalyP_jg7322 [Parmales sp. scaly parma]|nr:hypothetical protein ScalyP_jg7322 [Parmales sp. scaly parma]
MFRSTIRSFAGHSKWANIKHKKGKTDAARSKVITKLTKEIANASKNCKGDMDNLALQSYVSKAKAASVPKDRIHAAIDRGRNGGKSATDLPLEQLRYDGVVKTPGGQLSFIVLALSEKRTRTAPAVRHAFAKCGGELSKSGSNSFLFQEVGEVEVSFLSPIASSNEIEDEILGFVLDGEADDAEFRGEEEEEEEEEEEVDELKDNEGNKIVFDATTQVRTDALVKCEPKNLLKLVKHLRESKQQFFNDNTVNVIVKEFGVKMRVADNSNLVNLGEDEESLATFVKITDMFDENDDVTEYFHNAL